MGKSTLLTTSDRETIQNHARNFPRLGSTALTNRIIAGTFYVPSASYDSSRKYAVLNVIRRYRASQS